MPVETVTALFTDLVGSTGLQSTVGPAVAEELRREHFALLREAIAEADGEEVKNLGGELAQMMAGARDEHRFASVGPLELKGLPDPVTVFEVAWEPLPDAVERMPLPARLRGVPPVSCVGRTAVRERVASLWEAVSGGLRQAV